MLHWLDTTERRGSLIVSLYPLELAGRYGHPSTIQGLSIEDPGPGVLVYYSLYMSF